MFTADGTLVIFKMNTFCHPTLPELNVLFFFLYKNCYFLRSRLALSSSLQSLLLASFVDTLYIRKFNIGHREAATQSRVGHLHK